MRLVSGVKEGVELCLKRQNDHAVLMYCKVPELLVIPFEGMTTSLSKAKLTACQLLETLYPADLKESPILTPEEATNVEVLAGDVDGETDLDLKNLT